MSTTLQLPTTLAAFCEVNNLPEFNAWSEVAELLGITYQDESTAKDALFIHFYDQLPPAEQQAQKPATKPAPKATAAAPANDAAALIAQAMQLLSKPTEAAPIDEQAVIELIKKHAPVRAIEIKTADGSTNQVDGLQHSQFEKILRMIGAGLHVYLYGPAGTGKTQAAENAAQALGKPFYCISVCAQSTKSDLLGFIDATGKYCPSLFRKAFEEGGVFLIDEIDNGNPNVLAVLNAALANCVCAFPDGMVKRHPEFICIAAANTFGTGADRQYIGRNQIDAATLNRFVQVPVNYDEKLEQALYGPIAADVQKIRAALKGERVVISMRNIANTCKLIAAGYSKAEALSMAVIETLPENLRNRVNF